jgi:hypothetical protein
MTDPLLKLQKQQIEHELRRQTWNHTPGLSVQIRPEHFDPNVQAQIREQIEQYQLEDQPEKYMPLPRSRLTRFNATRFKAQLDIRLQEPDHFDQRPFGTVTINKERFRLVFQSYQIMMTDLWQCSQKEWRQWIYGNLNDYFKSIDAIVDPENANQMYPTSALYHDYDHYAKIHPEVENAFIILTYDDNVWLQVNGAVLILDYTVMQFQRLRRIQNTWRASASN